MKVKAYVGKRHKKTGKAHVRCFPTTIRVRSNVAAPARPASQKKAASTTPRRSGRKRTANKRLIETMNGGKFNKAEAKKYFKYTHSDEYRKKRARKQRSMTNKLRS